MDAVSHGLGYLSEDRKRYGLAIGLSVTDNATMASVLDNPLVLIYDGKL